MPDVQGLSSLIAQIGSPERAKRAGPTSPAARARTLGRWHLASVFVNLIWAHSDFQPQMLDYEFHFLLTVLFCIYVFVFLCCIYFHTYFGHFFCIYFCIYIFFSPLPDLPVSLSVCINMGLSENRGIPHSNR